MTEPALPLHPLGIDVMDRDHARLEELIARASVATEEELEALHAEVVQEISDHFAREEDLMRARDFPGLHCHCAQHKLLIEDARRTRPTERAALRDHIGVFIAQLLESHVQSLDYVTAAFLKGEFGAAQFEGLRLPVEDGPR